MATLKKGNIKHDFYATTGHNDCLRKIQSLNLDDYGAIVAVGGDGTVHEAINGMMTRADGRSIPLGFLPNGSGDDFCGGLGLGKGDLENGLKYLLSGQTIKVDLIKVLIDYESEEALDTAIQ